MDLGVDIMLVVCAVIKWFKLYMATSFLNRN